jgi:hypothetical protein
MQLTAQTTSLSRLRRDHSMPPAAEWIESFTSGGRHSVVCAHDTCKHKNTNNYKCRIYKGLKPLKSGNNIISLFRRFYYRKSSHLKKTS